MIHRFSMRRSSSHQRESHLAFQLSLSVTTMSKQLDQLHNRSRESHVINRTFGKIVSPPAEKKLSNMVMRCDDTVSLIPSFRLGIELTYRTSLGQSEAPKG